jgi:hypothetical protein
VESCPHCHFLIRDGARTCGVCHKPVMVAPAGGGAAYVAPAVDSMRIGPARSSGTPVAVVAMLLLVLVFAAGAGLAAHIIWA